VKLISQHAAAMRVSGAGPTPLSNFFTICANAFAVPAQLWMSAYRKFFASAFIRGSNRLDMSRMIHDVSTFIFNR
jgi:hypothetical protein